MRASPASSALLQSSGWLSGTSTGVDSEGGRGDVAGPGSWWRREGRGEGAALQAREAGEEPGEVAALGSPLSILIFL